jgi:hypothetical protein
MPSHPIRHNVTRATRCPTTIALQLLTIALVTGVTLTATADAEAATGLKSDRAYARAQLLKLSNMPHGWQQSGQVWQGTSAEKNSSSMLTVTQIPPLSTCLGVAPPLTVTASEANSQTFNSKDQSTNVFDVADVYSNAADAASDFPATSNPRFSACVIQVQGSGILSIEQSEWPSSVTFGTPTAAVVKSTKYGNQSALLEVQVPVNNLPDGGGSTTDFFTVLVIRQGRSTAELFIDQTDTPPSASLTNALAKAVVAKMKAPAPPPSNSVST